MRNPLHRKVSSRGTKANGLPAFLCGANVSAVQISAGTRASFAGFQLPPQSWSQLADVRPNLLIGFSSDFRRLLHSVPGAGITLSSVDRALVTLIQCGDSLLDEPLRRDLWAAFGVPVYEVFISPTGYPLALECEAHEGWHVEPGLRATLSMQQMVFEAKTGERFQSGMTGVILADPCSCGRPSLRVVGTQKQQRPASRNQRLACAAA